MALEGIFLGFATEADGMLVTAMTGGVTAALGYVREPVRAMMGLYVIVHGMKMVAGEASARSFMFAVVRAVCVVSILQAAYYVPWVQQQFFVTLPNDIAAALNGPRVTINTAQQFDALWSASLNAAGLILKKATGILDIADRAMVWIFAFIGLGGIIVMFAIFYLSKVTIAVLIIMGPFLIPFYLFGGTRQITSGWIGKVVGVLCWQLAAAVVVRLVIVAINARMQIMQANPGASVDQMIGTYAGICAMFWIGAIFMAVIPTAVAVGGGVGAAHTAAVVGAASMVGRAVSTAGAVKGLGSDLGSRPAASPPPPSPPPSGASNSGSNINVSLRPNGSAAGAALGGVLRGP